MRGNEFLNKHFNLLIKILIMKLLAKSKLVFYKLKNLLNINKVTSDSNVQGSSMKLISDK